jgi:hypothetical protein
MENSPFRNRRPSKRNAIATIGQAHNKPADLGIIRDTPSFVAIQGRVAALQAIVIEALNPWMQPGFAKSGV